MWLKRTYSTRSLLDLLDFSRSYNANTAAGSVLCGAYSGRSRRNFHRLIADCREPCYRAQEITRKFSGSLMASVIPKVSRKTGLLSNQTFVGSVRGIQTFLSAKNLVEKCPAVVQPYLKLIRADKPVGTWLLFWPCAWSIALAADPGSLPDLNMLALFGIGSFLMRGAGCIVNDLWDRDFDRLVERTRNRPLASGEIQVLPAMVWLSGQLGISLLVLLQLNWYSIILGASSLCLVSTYPLFKRFTYYPQAILGLTFNWGALLGYAAVRGYIDPFSVIPLYVAGFSWTMVYDTIYAHQDKTDDALVGVKSTALKFGERTPMVLWEFSTTMLFALGISGYAGGLTWPFFLGLAGVGGHLMYQTFTVNINDPVDCWNKFKSNHYLGLMVFLSIIAGNFFSSDKIAQERKDVCAQLTPSIFL